MVTEGFDTGAVRVYRYRYCKETTGLVVPFQFVCGIPSHCRAGISNKASFSKIFVHRAVRSSREHSGAYRYYIQLPRYLVAPLHQ